MLSLRDRGLRTPVGGGCTGPRVADGGHVYFLRMSAGSWGPGGALQAPDGAPQPRARTSISVDRGVLPAAGPRAPTASLPPALPVVPAAGGAVFLVEETILHGRPAKLPDTPGLHTRNSLRRRSGRVTVPGQDPRSDTQRPRLPTTRFPAGGPLHPWVAHPLDPGCGAGLFRQALTNRKAPRGPLWGTCFIF